LTTDLRNDPIIGWRRKGDFVYMRVKIEIWIILPGRMGNVQRSENSLLTILGQAVKATFN